MIIYIFFYISFSYIVYMDPFWWRYRNKKELCWLVVLLNWAVRDGVDIGRVQATMDSEFITYSKFITLLYRIISQFIRVASFRSKKKSLWGTTMVQNFLKNFDPIRSGTNCEWQRWYVIRIWYSSEITQEFDNYYRK